MIAYSCKNRLKILGHSNSYLHGDIITGDNVKCFDIIQDSTVMLVQTLSSKLKKYDFIGFDLLDEIDIDCDFIKITDDGSKFLTMNYEGIKIWDLESMELIKSIRETNSSSKIFCTNYDGSLVLSFFTHEKKIKVTDTTTNEFYFIDINFSGEESRPSFHASKTYDDILLTPDQSSVLVVSYKSIKIYDIKTGECLSTIRCESQIGSVIFMNSGIDILVSCYRDLKKYNIISGEVVNEYHEFSNYYGIKVSLNSEETKITFISGKKIYIFDLDKSRVIYEINLPEEDVGFLNYIVKYAPSNYNAYN